MAVTGVTKWSCPTCTYSNWLTSSKCSLCSSPRPNEVSPQWSSRKHSPSSMPAYSGEVSNTHSPDINYKNSSSSDTSSHHKASKCKTKTKWACVTCTYTNWPNAHQCVMCGAQKSKLKAESSGSTNRFYPISESILEYATSKGAVGGACVQEERIVPQVKPSRLKKESKNGKSNTDKKWKCQQCTFDNYSKSIKCVMCQARRIPSPVYEDRSTLPHSSHHTPSTRHTLLHTPPLNANKMAVKSTPSPPSSPKPLSSTATLNDKNSSRDSETDNTLVEKIESLEVAPLSLKSDSDQVRQIRNRLTNSDWLFLNACLGVVNGEMSAIRPYLRQVGDRSRQLTKDECLVIGQRHSLGVGSTLVHLAIRFQRSEMLSLLLTPASSEARKRLPSETSPDLAASIRKEFSLSLWQHKGEWAVYFVTQLTTFTLPSDIRKFCSSVQKKVLDDVVDRDVEQELAEGCIINWSSEVVGELGSKLHPLWNRTAGDCLLDSVLQATWGVMDREATLRRAMADSLSDGASRFYNRWKESEQRLSIAQGYSLDEDQLRQDWEAVLSLADQPGRALEQAHIFVLAHLLRRPIIVYGVRVVKNYRGENLGFANFEGVYLPLLWEANFCWKTPIAMAYTRGHFSALVAMTMQQPSGAGVHSNVSHDNHVTYLPLTDSDGHLLQIHFLTEQELGSEEHLLNEYCDCHMTRLGTLTARQELLPGQQPTLMVQLMGEWLDRYRRLDKRQGGSSSACVHHPDS